MVCALELLSLIRWRFCLFVWYSSSCTNLESYKRAVAFVMAYSFSEPTTDSRRTDSESSTDSVVHKGPPMMVPVADILNHVANNNARLDFGVKNLRMVATRPIAEVHFLLVTYFTCHSQLQRSPLMSYLTKYSCQLQFFMLSEVLKHIIYYQWQKFQLICNCCL